MAESIRPSRAGTIFTARGTSAAMSAAMRRCSACIDQIGLIEHDEIGAQHLILKNLFERIVMRDGRIGLALARQFDGIVGEASIGDRLAVDNRDHAVDG